MSGALPIGIVVPTRNCVQLLEPNFPALQRVLGVAQEVVIVDSESKDGTLQLLQTGLAHPAAKFLTHPPGLYESWNFGLKQLTAPYAYIATAGDSITPAGLSHLYEVARRFEADLVLSKPQFVTEDGMELTSKKWTIHRVIQELHFKTAGIFQRSHFFLTSALFGMAGVMGSAASNLFKTEYLQQNLFPGGFGHVGDTAWGILNALHIRTALTPEPCARFILHANAGEVSAREEMETETKLLELAHSTLDAALAAGVVPSAGSRLHRVLQDYDFLRRQIREAAQLYDNGRKRGTWLLSPKTWRARSRRNHLRAQLLRLWRGSLKEFSF